MRRRPTTALVAACFVAVPLLLFRYAATHCTELACLGAYANAVLDAVVVLPLLAVWVARRGAVAFAMLACSEAAMAATTLRRDFDFAVRPAVAGVVLGLTAGAAIGALVSRATRAG